MEILRWLESIRTPFLDGFFSAITHLGEETIFIVLGILFFGASTSGRATTCWPWALWVPWSTSF